MQTRMLPQSNDSGESPSSVKAKTTSPTHHRAEPPQTEEELPDPVESIVDDLNQQDFMPSDEETILEEFPEVGQNALLMSHSWDEAGVENGDRVARVPLEDETSCSERLVQDGMEEADEELRDLEEQDDIDTE